MKLLTPRYTLACLLLAGSCAQADTLVEIYEMALENDPQLKADEAAYRAGLEQKAIGRAGLLPSLNASASYSESSREEEGTGPDADNQGNFFVRPIDSERSGDSTGIDATLSQPLFNMNRWYTYKRGSVLSDQASVQFLADQQSFVIRVADAYFNVLRAIDTLETARAEERATMSQLEQTQQRYEVGLTAITDVHEAQAAADGARASALQAEGNLGIAYEALEVLTGEVHNSIAPIQDNFPVQNPTPADRAEWVEMALKTNYQLAAAKLSADSAQYSAKAAKADHYPTLGASLNYSSSDSYGEVEGVAIPSDSTTESTSIGVRLDIPIYNGGGTSARRRAAYQDYYRARELYNKAHRDTIQSTRSLHLSVETSAATVDALEQQIVSSTSALEATQAGYEVGTRTLVDVLLAQRTLYQAQRNYYDALYNYILSTLRLKEAAGVLSMDDMEELNQWLDTVNQIQRSQLQ